MIIQNTHTDRSAYLAAHNGNELLSFAQALTKLHWHIYANDTTHATLTAHSIAATKFPLTYRSLMPDMWLQQLCSVPHDTQQLSVQPFFSLLYIDLPVITLDPGATSATYENIPTDVRIEHIAQLFIAHLVGTLTICEHSHIPIALDIIRGCHNDDPKKKQLLLEGLHGTVEEHIALHLQLLGRYHVQRAGDTFHFYNKRYLE